LVLGFDPKFKVWKEYIVSAGEGLFHIKLAAKSRREKVWKRGVIRRMSRASIKFDFMRINVCPGEGLFINLSHT
jgi:hypothetical protein